MELQRQSTFSTRDALARLESLEKAKEVHEPWCIVQALTYKHAPLLYADLQKVRQQIVKRIDFTDAEGSGPKTSFLPKRGELKWEDVEITPEITLNPYLSYVAIRVAKGTIFKLKRLLDAQQELVRRLKSVNKDNS